MSHCFTKRSKLNTLNPTYLATQKANYIKTKSCDPDNQQFGYIVRISIRFRQAKRQPTLNCDQSKPTLSALSPRLKCMHLSLARSIARYACLISWNCGSERNVLYFSRRSADSTEASDKNKTRHKAADPVKRMQTSFHSSDHLFGIFPLIGVDRDR